MGRKFVLPNGVRLLLEKMPALKSVTIGVWVNVGSRDERKGEEGLSHFLEHMFFKGTRARSAAQISSEIDALGGDINAFTGHETTTYFVKVLDQHVKPAVDLLADLFHHSRFDQKEIEKEKEVVLEEIRTAQDDPEDFAQELHASHVFAGHPLGRPILGDRHTVKRVHRRDLQRYVQSFYRPEQTLVAVAGNFRMDEVRSLLEAAFGHWTRNGSDPRIRRPPVVRGGIHVHRRQLEQAHLCLGFRGLPVVHRDRYAALVLNAALGGSMSSRLFQAVREKRGLAYSVYSHLGSFVDGGLLVIYAATRPQEAVSVIDVICREVRRLRRHGVSRAELDRCKNQVKGSLMLGLESSFGRMNKLVKDELYEGRQVPLSEILAQIDRVTEGQAGQVARDLLDFQTLSVTGVGPLSQRSLEHAVG